MKKAPARSSIFVFFYTATIFLWFVSWLLVGDAIWWLTLINRVVPYLFFPVPFILIWAIFTRNLTVIIPLLVPAAIFGFLYHPYLFPNVTKSPENKFAFSVMTYNVLYSNLNDGAAANVILTYHPDLVALQEVQAEMMDALSRRTSKIVNLPLFRSTYLPTDCSG